MLKIALPINPYDLGYLLSSIDGYIDLELSEKIGCSLVVGTHAELNKERSRLELPDLQYDNALCISTENYSPQNFTIPMHCQRSKYIGALVNANNEQASNKDMHIKYSVVSSALNRYKDLRITRFPLPGKQQRFVSNVENEGCNSMNIPNVEIENTQAHKSKKIIIFICAFFGLLSIILFTIVHLSSSYQDIEFIRDLIH